MDRHFFSKEEGYRIDQEDKARFKLRGKRNLFILAAVIGVILIYGQVCHLRFDMSILGEHVEGMALLRDIAILSLGFLSVFVTPKTIHHKNLFSYAPLTEILAVFFAIFVTLIPLIDAMKQGKSGIFSPILSLMDTSNDHASLLYFWISGLLSAFLDNAPTYLVFFNLAGGDAELLTTQLKPILIGLSAGTVFMGAMSYIGNAPNFMVRSLAVHRGIPMPSFFGFLGWSCCILIPIFVLYSVFIKFFLHY